MMIPRMFYGAAVVIPFIAAAEEVQLKAERVALFSNGYSQVSLIGELPVGTRAELKGVPAPVEGTLWWSMPQGVKVVQLEGSVREREVPSAEYSPAEALKANIGKHVRLRMEDGRAYEGTLVRPQLPPKGELTYTNHRGSVHQQQLSQQAPVFLQTAEGEYVDVDCKTLQSIEWRELPVTPSRKELQPLLTMELQQAAPGGAFRLDCLAQGLSWRPTYRIDLRGENKATVTCKAVIINDMVDLEGARLELVSGQPELGHDGLPLSPLTRLDAMDNAVLRAAKARARNAAEPVALRSDSFSEEGDDEADGESITRTEELYHYAIPSFSAKKNSAVAREIFSQEAECRHVYTCRLSPRTEEGEVWHSLSLKNESTWLWSPGTVVCFADGRMLARAELKSTAAGQEVTLPLALTQEITVRQSQKKLKTEPLATSRSGEETTTTYEGTITLENHAAHAVDIELSNHVNGAATTASHGGEINVSPGSAENSSSRILWKCRLEAGEKRSLTYTYEHRSR